MDSEISACHTHTGARASTKVKRAHKGKKLACLLKCFIKRVYLNLARSGYTIHVIVYIYNIFIYIYIYASIHTYEGAKKKNRSYSKCLSTQTQSVYLNLAISSGPSVALSS